MKIICRFTAIVVMACFSTSCGPQPPEVQFVRQKIPIEIQSGKPVTIEISSLSGNGANDVGIRCSPDVWNVLTNSTKAITFRLISSSKQDTTIEAANLGGGSAAFLGYIPNVHYLFNIGGHYGANASVEITFLNAPLGTTHAEIIIGKTPADTGP